jgi:putative lipoprotein
MRICQSQRWLGLMLACLTAGCQPEEIPSPAGSGATAGDMWEQAALRGVDFRASGNEPGWTVEIREGESIVVDTHYGTRHYEIAAATPVGDPASGGQLYRDESGLPGFELVLIDQPCADDMSGEHFPTTVRLSIDDETFNGCGRALVRHR